MLAEKRKEMHQIKKETKKAEEGKQEQDKSTFLVRNNKLYINGQLQRKELLPPQPMDMFLNSSDKDRMAKIKFKLVQSQPTKDSQFTAYACVAESIEDMRWVYKWLFRENPEAYHISAAFCAENGSEAYQDDAEFGAGFRLLYTICDFKLLNVAVFIVRHYGGENLGPLHFTVMKNIAEEALSKLN